MNMSNLKTNLKNCLLTNQFNCGSIYREMDSSEVWQRMIFTRLSQIVALLTAALPPLMKKKEDLETITSALEGVRSLEDSITRDKKILGRNEN